MPGMQLPCHTGTAEPAAYPCTSLHPPAGKVYKELFRSGSTAVLVDASGAEYQCVVQSEARNDMRPQFTLRVGRGGAGWCREACVC